MSTEWRRTLLFLLLIGALTTSGAAQMRAITQDGQVVLLYPDGTWRYEYDSNRRDDYSWGRGDSQINIDAGATGKRFGALIDGHLYFIINDGQLEDLYIYDARGRVVYSLQDGIDRVPFDWTIQYNIGNARRIRKLGPYEFEYHCELVNWRKWGIIKSNTTFTIIRWSASVSTGLITTSALSDFHSSATSASITTL